MFCRVQYIWLDICFNCLLKVSYLLEILRFKAWYACTNFISVQVHSRTREEEKMRVCSALNYEKLSAEALKHFALNSKFPSRAAVKSFIKQQSKLKSLLQNTHRVVGFSSSLDAKEYMGETADAEEIHHYVNKKNFSAETENFEAHYHRMQWRVMELEKICRIMQTDMGNITKRRLSSLGNARYLPRLCS